MQKLRSGGINPPRRMDRVHQAAWYEVENALSPDCATSQDSAAGRRGAALT